MLEAQPEDDSQSVAEPDGFDDEDLLCRPCGGADGEKDLEGDLSKAQRPRPLTEIKKPSADEEAVDGDEPCAGCLGS